MVGKNSDEGWEWGGAIFSLFSHNFVRPPHRAKTRWANMYVGRRVSNDQCLLAGCAPKCAEYIICNCIPFLANCLNFMIQCATLWNLCQSRHECRGHYASPAEWHLVMHHDLITKRLDVENIIALTDNSAHSSTTSVLRANKSQPFSLNLAKR